LASNKQKSNLSEELLANAIDSLQCAPMSTEHFNDESPDDELQRIRRRDIEWLDPPNSKPFTVQKEIFRRLLLQEKNNNN
jgi:hypothetical protein